jgi:hypothetical protein
VTRPRIPRTSTVDAAAARAVFGRRLDAWLLASERTASELGKLLRVSSSATVARWIAGDAMPRSEHMAALRALGMPEAA